jgi:putative acyl-CoA dehydrogenase
MAVWEGSGNVIALDVLRALSREPESLAAFDAEVALTAGEHPVFDAHLAATRRQVAEVLGADERAAAASARRLVADLALALQASLLLRTAPDAVSHAFIESRLGENRGRLYGELPPGGRLSAILERS